MFVAFEQFVRPALLHMMGATALYRPRRYGMLTHDVSTDPEKVVFLRVVVGETPAGIPEVTSAGGQSSNVLSAMAAADAFAVVPVGVAGLEAGDQVELEMFRLPAVRTREEALGG